MSQNLILNNHSISYKNIADKNFPPTLTENEARVVTFCSDWLNAQNQFLLTTSGSTGIPKTIIAESTKMSQSAQMTINALDLKENDKSLICLNTDFIGGKMMLVRGLIANMEMTIIEPASNPLKGFDNDIKFDFTALVPLQMNTILSETPEKKKILDNMKAIIIGGASISAVLEDKIRSVKAPVYHTFGMTETLSHIALRRINGIEPEDYYTALGESTIEADERNCLIIHTPLSDKPIFTNDVIEIINKKQFKWLGRADFIINSGGIKIHPEKIEKVIEKILSNQLTIRFFVIGLKDEKLGEAIHLFIEDKQWSNQKIEELNTHLRNSLLKYEIPKRIHFIESFKETASGKIDRRNTARG